jgi:hypothetical protein
MKHNLKFACMPFLPGGIIPYIGILLFRQELAMGIFEVCYLF